MRHRNHAGFASRGAEHAVFFAGDAGEDEHGRVYERRRKIHAAGFEGAGAMPRHAGNAGGNQKPPALYPEQQSAISTGKQRLNLCGG